MQKNVTENDRVESAKKSPLPVFIYSDQYNMDLGPHVFPSVKFKQIYDRLKVDERFSEHRFVEPVPLTRKEAETVHKKSLITDLLDLRMSPRVNRSELPLTKPIIDAFFLGSGGTLLAAREALENGRAMNIGGGFHHAFADHAEGFCYLNDIAIAIRVLQKEKSIRNAIVIDLDVHQGNGTAKIFRHSRSVFTFSMHETRNYPLKEKGSLDIGLDTGLGDDDYLFILEGALLEIKNNFSPDMIFYVAGVDPYEKDRLGGLSITKKGMKKRDEMIRDFLPGIPLVTVLAGGYALDTVDTVDLHLQTCEVLADL